MQPVALQVRSADEELGSVVYDAAAASLEARGFRAVKQGSEAAAGARKLTVSAAENRLKTRWFDGMRLEASEDPCRWDPSSPVRSWAAYGDTRLYFLRRSLGPSRVGRVTLEAVLDEGRGEILSRSATVYVPGGADWRACVRREADRLVRSLFSRLSEND
ncbi:MAG: hypothetical protein J7M29_12905 [Verrucomicrobia bacterium]|nr:hypothetical protein [Verrucomicrobiota bacterium]